MGAPRSTGGFQVHRNDLDRLADYVDEITPVGPGVSQSPTRKGRYIAGPAPVSTPQSAPPGASTTALLPFQLVDASDNTGAKVRVVTSTVIGDVPSGFSAGDNPPYVLDVNDGDIVYAVLQIDTDTGEVTSRTLDCDPQVPRDDPASGTFHVRIGSVAVTAGEAGGAPTVQTANDLYGPVQGAVYLDYFSSPTRFLLGLFVVDSPD